MRGTTRTPTCARRRAGASSRAFTTSRRRRPPPRQANASPWCLVPGTWSRTDQALGTKDQGLVFGLRHLDAVVLANVLADLLLLVPGLLAHGVASREPLPRRVKRRLRSLVRVDGE